MASPTDDGIVNNVDKRVRELEKWKPVATLQIERLEKEHQDTRLTRELFLKSVDVKFAEFRDGLKADLGQKAAENKELGNKRDAKMDGLDLDMRAIQKKVWFATGVIVAVQFAAPIVLKAMKVF